jgi:uncharacterized membrane protein YjjP (DUF1212 family)
MTIPSPAPAPHDLHRTTARRDVRFILAVARALHSSGTTAQRLEDVLETLARRFGLREPQFFSTPTSIMCAFGEPESQEVHLLRLAPSGPNIGKLSRLNRVVTDVLDGAVSLEEAMIEVEAIQVSPSPYGTLLTVFAFGLGSAGIARFLGGGMMEIGVGALLGVITGTIEAVAERSEGMKRVFEPLASFIAAFIATSVAALVGPYASATALLAGIIVLLPGLTLTNAVRELSERHLASGTARLAGAATVLLGLTFGVALGDRTAAVLFGKVAEGLPLALPLWTLAVSLAAAGLSFVVILKAEWRDAGWMVSAGVFSYLLGSLGARYMGPELGLFMAAAVNGIGAALWGRWRRRPQSVVLVPATLMLVPGSVGFRSLNSLMEQNVIDGVQTAFTMVLAATALSAGLLVAGLLVPSRRRQKELA